MEVHKPMGEVHLLYTVYGIQYTVYSIATTHLMKQVYEVGFLAYCHCSLGWTDPTQTCGKPT